MTVPLSSGRRGLTNGLVREGPHGVGRTNGLVNGLRGRTNGLVNGTRGRTNGLVNGTRVAPGKGRVNGTGLVNGSGFVNGLPLRRNPFGIVTHRDLRRGVAIIVIAVVAVPVIGYLLGEPPPGPPGFAVDGDFREWGGSPEYPDDEDAPPGLDLESVSFHIEEGRLYAHGKVRGPLFAGPQPTSLYVLLHDGSASGTRYAAAQDFTANAIAEMYGWDGGLQGSRTRIWSGGSDADDASGFRRGGGFPTAVVGSEFELSLDLVALDVSATPALRMRLASQGANGEDASAIVGPGPGVLLVHQENLTSSISGPADVLRVTLWSYGARIRVTGLPRADTGPNVLQLPTFPVVVPANGSQALYYRMDPASLADGTLLGVEVLGADAVVDGTSTPVPATVSGDGARLYVGNPPSGKTIDGLFDDWTTNTTADADDPNATTPDATDLLESGSALQAGAFFYARTEGQVLAGAILPERPAKPSPGGNASTPSPPVPIPRVAGEDVLRIYVDTDDRDAAGFPFAGIRADRLVEVHGRFGQTRGRALSAWDPVGARWVPQSESIDVALVGRELEASVPAAFLGPTNNASVVFAMSDWQATADVSDASGLRGTRGGPGVRPWDGDNYLNVDATVLTNTPDATDANCASFAGEYDGATSDGNADLAFWIGRRDDTQYVYACIEVGSDTSQNALDFGEILFDTNHDDVDPPQDEDRMFRLYSGPFALLAFKGDGLGWTSCGTSCDAGDDGSGGLTNGQEVYEFQIRYSDVWGTNTPEPSDRAGFAIIVYDADVPATYWWGADNVDEGTPSTWGQLDIPEFSQLGFLVVFIVPVVLLARRRRAANS